MTAFLVEKEPGFGEVAPGLTGPGKIEKLGYRGIDTTELIFNGHHIAADQVLGGEPGRRFPEEYRLGRRAVRTLAANPPWVWRKP